MFGKLIAFLEKNQLECLYVKYFGVRCPGCGLQTSIIELLKGKFFESFKAYPPLYSIIIMLIFLILHLIFKIKNGAKILIFIYIFTSLTIIINYIYQLLN